MYSVRYYPRFHVTAVGLGMYCPWIRGHTCIWCMDSTNMYGLQWASDRYLVILVKQLHELARFLESATNRIILKKDERLDVTWCQVRPVRRVFETLPSRLMQSLCRLVGCVACGAWRCKIATHHPPLGPIRPCTQYSIDCSSIEHLSEGTRNIPGRWQCNAETCSSYHT
jgi:hypothetical protein